MESLNIIIILSNEHLMNFKNSKNLLLIAAAVLVILVSFIIYSTHDTSQYSGGGFVSFDQFHDTKVVESINIQNDVLNNYFNSIYDSQLSDIESKYNEGFISQEERNKQFNAVIKNRELTVNTLNKLSDTKKDIFTGNITKQDILFHINSFSNINSDIKSDINDTLYGN